MNALQAILQGFCGSVGKNSRLQASQLGTVLNLLREESEAHAAIITEYRDRVVPLLRLYVFITLYIYICIYIYVIQC